MTKMSSRAIILKLESKSFLSFYNGFFIITLSALGQFGIWLKIKNKKQKKKMRVWHQEACAAPPASKNCPFTVSLETPSCSLPCGARHVNIGGSI
jgi:hypothetical protein